MPTPVELVTAPMSLFLSYGAPMLRETLLPGRRLPAAAGGRIRSRTAFLFYVFLSPRLPDLGGGIGAFTTPPASTHGPFFNNASQHVAERLLFRDAPQP